VNIFDEAMIRHQLFIKRYEAFFSDFCHAVFDRLLAEVKEHTPVDYGALREGFEAHSSIDETGNGYVLRIVNPADYALHVEWGYLQKGGMILQMRMERGRLRFKEFLGRASKWGRGPSTGKAQPDANGDYVIVTRERKIPGVHMVSNAMEKTLAELPALYATRFEVFRKTTPWISAW
jgi:hypothetical protein